MGFSRANAFLVSLDLNNMALGDEGKCESLWEKVLAYQEKRGLISSARKQRNTRRSNGGVIMRSTRPRRSILMKRISRLEGYTKPQSPIERKVRTLKKLIPNSEARNLDGLFMQTADYILSLQMRVNVMQILVKALTGCDE